MQATVCSLDLVVVLCAFGCWASAARQEASGARSDHQLADGVAEQWDDGNGLSQMTVVQGGFDRARVAIRAAKRSCADQTLAQFISRNCAAAHDRGQHSSKSERHPLEPSRLATQPIKHTAQRTDPQQPQ